MMLNNPMKNMATRAKMIASLKGRTFLARGGNGKTTVPQEILAGRVHGVMEYAIATTAARDFFLTLPNHYKVDIAFPKLKIAIEVDGQTHKTKKWKFLDRRKTEVLEFLGWSVLRFWNEEILKDLDSVAGQIELSIISR